MIEPLSKWLRQFAYQHAQQLIRVWDNDPFMPDGTADLVDPVLILQGDLLLADIDQNCLVVPTSMPNSQISG